MLCFTVNRNGHSAPPVSLAGSYVVGSDSVPLRAELEMRDDHTLCAKRADGPAGVALLWPVHGCGSIFLETSRLTERSRPYNLPLEFARAGSCISTRSVRSGGSMTLTGLSPSPQRSTRRA